MGSAHTFDYDRVKEAILKKFQINKDTFRRRFHSTDIQPSETPRLKAAEHTVKALINGHATHALVETGSTLTLVLDSLVPREEWQDQAPVKGPLDLLKEFWEGPRGESKNVVVYVLQMGERLEQMTTLVRENIAKS
ncbi:hypothetical protein SKAU_G00398660 [Synaphobranchus kaupii]|uniref:Uncharacterized protein n=1 Tax=Synaphobranchus kaupii TaxID=118154 RepID=A0A9Q1E8N0_SYNKA|nr:hypothetical protein SKAU_G00398660 [Synaphobranchus kaupii]